MEATSSRRKVFTQEKKQLIIKEHYSQGISIPVLARKYGVHAITLYSWKRQMNHKKDESPVNAEYIQKLIEENDKLKAENQNLKAKVGELAIKNDILKDGLEIVQKKAILKALQPPKKSKRLIGMK
ncbi:transposase [Bdellovibrio bacteriovorus]|jgi:transposase-like protein|uniref:transposase n=1 Tax=Bdellovibrio bacteriovorus TaxID=959 RepID=UPI0035A68821